MHIHLSLPDLRASFTRSVTETTQRLYRSPVTAALPRVVMQITTDIIPFVSQSSVISVYSEVSTVRVNRPERQHRQVKMTENAPESHKIINKTGRDNAQPNANYRTRN